MSRNILGIKGIANKVQMEAESISLYISANKTPDLLSGTHQPLTNAFIDQKEIAIVDNFTYLGSFTNEEDSIDYELQCKINKASAAFNQK